MRGLSRRSFAGGLVAAGVSAPPAGARETPGRTTLVATWGGGEPPACYVPAGGGPSPTFSSSKLLERLACHRADGRFAGELAEAWTPAADFRSYTVAIRRGVTFHDGQPMTAADVIYSIDEIWKKHAAAPSLAGYAGATARDDATVVVAFDAPMPAFAFAALLSGANHYIVPRHLYAGSDPATNPANAAPVGTGPWRFKAWVRGSHFEFVRNDAYWRPVPTSPDRLILRYIRDPAGRAAAMEAGEIDIGVFNPVPPADARRLAASGRFVATTRGYADAAWSTTLECNLRRPLFARREVRQAMFFAVDRALLARTVYAGQAHPGSGPIASSNTEYFSTGTFSTAFDPARAAALLDAAGYPRKAGGKRFAVTLVAAGWFAENGRVGELVRQGLEEIGVAVTLAVPDRATALRRLYTDYDFDLAISNMVQPAEPVPEVTRYFTSDGIRKGVPFRNATGFHDAAVDALVAQIRVETDPARRRALVGDFQKIVSVEAPLLPLVELDPVTLAGARVRNHGDEANVLAASWHDIGLDA